MIDIRDGEDMVDAGAACAGYQEEWSIQGCGVTVHGADGDDRLKSPDDLGWGWLYGGAGDDFLIGGRDHESDTGTSGLDGGPGSDTLFG